MAFAQLLEFTTSDPAQVDRVREDWEQATEGRRTARRVVVMNHHDDARRQCVLVFFDSYESAMQNSELPQTQEFAERLKEAVDGEVTYVDLDVVEDKQV